MLGIIDKRPPNPFRNTGNGSDNGGRVDCRFAGTEEKATLRQGQALKLGGSAAALAGAWR